MALLYKELRLAAHPSSIVFSFLGCLVLVPAYPFSVVFDVRLPRAIRPLL